ncbi:MAG: histidine kinase [Sphingobacteriales bacterium]|nr:histidine kinase [Sphingobacteriales bacterium]
MNALTKRRPYFLFHLAGWLAFIGFQFILLPRQELFIKDGKLTPFCIDQFVVNGLAVAFFYLHSYFLLPVLYFKKKYIRYLFLLTACLGLSLFVVVKINQLHPPPSEIPTNIKGIPEFRENPLAPPSPVQAPPHVTLMGEKIFLYATFFLKFLLVFLISIALKIYRNWQTAEEEKYKAELLFLKSQINPHFLFNILNSIYVQAIRKAENTAPSIMKLSSIMRYVISEGHHPLVPLEKEIGYVSDYIDLQKMRLSNSIIVDYQLNIQQQDLMIAPLLLITFIENAFKHGISTEEDGVIKITIDISNSQLLMNVRNNKYKTALREEEQSGIGIKNTKKRLNLIYPDKHELTIENNDTSYTAILKLNLS